MAVFDGHTVTVKGAKLLSRSLAGEGKFVFTKGAFGAGKYAGDATTLEELIDKRLDLPISDITYYEGAAVLNLQISNKTVEESFYTEELGLYAKLENDNEEVLFSYAKAIKPDAIPDNSLSVTFEGEYELYIKLTTNEKVGVQVNDSNVYITFKTGNREYVRTGCNIIGLLSVQTELVENGQYQAENGKWYLNVGGKRVWNRDGSPDDQLKEISFLQHEKDLNKKQYKEDSLLKTISKKIVGAINELFTNKLEKGGYSGTAQDLLTEISKIASKSILGRIIIGKGLSVDSLGRTSIVSKNDGITINESDIQLNTVDNVVTDSGTKPLSARQGKKLNEDKQNKEDSTLKTIVKTIVGAINELFNNKLEKGGYTGNAKNLNDEISKKASKSVLGRVIIGDNLTVDSNGRVSGNPQYVHPSGNGNSHIPVNGTTGQFLKWLSAGVAQWVSITWSDITGKPVAMKNPTAVTIKANGTSLGSYDGSIAKEFNITYSNVGAAAAGHSHSAGDVGAYTKNEIDTKLGGKANSSHSHTATQIAQDSSHRYVTDTEKSAWNGKLNKGSLPAKISDAKGLYDLIENNSGLNFDPNLLFLNDAGTKYVNRIYFDRNKKGMFKCISQTTATTNSTSYFVDISNNSNSDQLRNLSTIPDKIPLMITGHYSKFLTNKSIRIKNKQEPLIIQCTVAYENHAFEGFILATPPVSKIYIPESELIYDGSDNNYLYYHISSSSGNAFNNSIFIIQP